jgi:ubiquinone/menaquinone biosynthesis C-methylase UbiE
LNPGGIWADLGAGSGAFTLALRELVGPNAMIYAVDKDRTRLNELEGAYRARFGDTKNLQVLAADFSRSLDLPILDGILMANSLHYFKVKEKVLRHVRNFLKPNSILLLVEYNVDSGNPWVPYPLSFESFHVLTPRTGFNEPRLLAKHPSSFLREFYSAIAYKQAIETQSARRYTKRKTSCTLSPLCLIC